MKTLLFKMVLMTWMLALMKVGNPKQAGRVAAWSVVVNMWLHISALLCFADLCGSLLFMACDISWFFSLLSFVFKFSRHLVYHVDSLGFISHISFYGNSRDAMSPSPATIASSAGSSTGSCTASTTMSFPPSMVQQIVDAVKDSLTAEKGADQPPARSTSGELLSVHLLCRLLSAFTNILVLVARSFWLLVAHSHQFLRFPQVLKVQGTQSFVVPSFVNTFSPLVPSILPSYSATSAVGPSLSISPCSANSTFTMPSERLSTNTITTCLPVLQQPFVVGPSFPPVPAKNREPDRLWEVKWHATS